MNKTRVAIIHPDLGIGGAERLIVDLCLALKESNFSVKIYTSYHDKNRCFEETRDGTLQVITVGSWIPRTLFSRFHALMAYIKMIYIALHLLIFSKHDYVLCDQVSACIPVLRLDFINRAKILFYCHFPDKLLTKRDSILKSIYRIPLDWFEGWSTSLAHHIIVNSKFTSHVVRDTFKHLRNRHMDILYPCVDIQKFRDSNPRLDECSAEIKDLVEDIKDSFVFLSLNRFERKKDLALAIRSMNECLTILKSDGDSTSRQRPHLVVAGGYDERLEDSVRYYNELKTLVAKLNLKSHVSFALSPSENEKLVLLKLSQAVIYTPTNEHFGIVPLEAMAMSRPVIACNSGGPLETIKHGSTGFLSPSNPKWFAKYMNAMVRDVNSDRLKMGEKGCKFVTDNFSKEKFCTRLKSILAAV